MNHIAIEMQPAAPQSPAPEASYFIVTQVKANRVVFFTDDVDYAPPMDGDWYYLSQYHGALPEGMTLRNCWRWRFNGGVFTDAKAVRQKPAEEALIDNNRKALFRILREKINELRAPLLPKTNLGTVLRARKLSQAQAYLQTGADTDCLLLEGLAQARNISLHDSALLVIDRASEANRVLEETEVVRERFTQAIRAATTGGELLELRERLLNEVSPASSARFRYKVKNTTPADPAKPLAQTHRVHEAARLKAQLRERINAARSTQGSGYTGHEYLQARKEALARLWLECGDSPAGDTDFTLLRSEAESSAKSVREIAEATLARGAAQERLMVRTEADKLRILSLIEGIVTLGDVREVSVAIAALRWDDL